VSDPTRLADEGGDDATALERELLRAGKQQRLGARDKDQIWMALTAQLPLAPLVLWPVALMWGSAIAPLPGGGGAVEVGFKAALGHAIPARIFGAALVWWRFYTFYLFILLGALAAGGTVLRALRDDPAENDEEPDPTAATA